MKRILTSKVFLIFVMIGAMIILFAFLFGRAKPVKIGEIETFSLSHRSENTAYGDEHYALRLEDGVYTASVKPLNVPTEETQSFAVDEEFARELEQILIDNGVGKWNGFDKVDKRVLDGRSFSLYITMTDGTSVDAHGYMRWPKNYTDVNAAVEALFQTHMPQ